jgi:hypothetical protein
MVVVSAGSIAGVIDSLESFPVLRKKFKNTVSCLAEEGPELV